LSEAANRLKSCMGAVVTVARVGGDEFVVVLSQLDTDGQVSRAQAQLIAEKISALLAAPYTLTVRQAGLPDGTVEHRCTASIGVALFINHATSQTDILKHADAAMYQAKKAGRNAICFSDAAV